MDQVKSLFKSKTFYGALVAILSGIAGAFGYAIDTETQAALTSNVEQLLQLVSSIGAVGGGLFAVWGRVKATKVIGPSDQKGAAGIVMLVIVALAGLSINASNADKAGHPVTKWRDVKHSVEVSVEQRKPLDYSKMNQ